MIYLKNPLCLGMEESEYKEMLSLGGMRQKHFEKNEVILSAGCTTHEIGLVLSGSVNIENLDLWGSKSILSNIGAGQVFGETYAFSHETLMVDAVAAQQTDILFWNLDILVHTPHPASTWQPKFIRNLLQISLRKNLALSQRIFCTTPKTIRGRLLVYLSNQAAKAGSNHFKIPFDRQGLEKRILNSIFRILLIFAYVKCHCVQTVLISFHQFLYRLSHESLLYQ